MRAFTALTMVASVACMAPAQASPHVATVTGKVSNGDYGNTPPRDNAGLFNGAVVGDPFSISFFYDASKVSSKIEQSGVTTPLFFVLDRAEVQINSVKFELKVNAFYDFVTFRQDQDYVLGKPVQNLSIGFNIYPSINESYYSSISLFSKSNEFFTDQSNILTGGDKAISIDAPYRSFSSKGWFSGGLVTSNGTPVFFEMMPESFSVSAVPEPATWALMFLGFAMVAGATRYGRRRVAVTYA